jgi:uncharacterized protein
VNPGTPYLDILPHQLAELLAEPNLLIIDHRDALSHARGHLDGARLAEEALLKQLMRQRQTPRPVLVYCYRGNSSQDLCRLISGFGYPQVYNLAGGWQAWEAHLAASRADTSPLADELAAWIKAQGFDEPHLNARLDNGMTPLMVAALKGTRPQLEQLLALGADPNHVNDDQHHALWFACVQGDPEVVTLLIDHGAHVDNQNVNGATCAIYAASTGKLAVLQRLVDAGANLHLETTGGYTALESASTLPVLKYLRSRAPERETVSLA